MNIARLPEFVRKNIQKELQVNQSSFAKNQYFSHLTEKSQLTQDEKMLVDAYNKLHSLNSKYQHLLNNSVNKAESEKLYSELVVLKRQIAMLEKLAFDNYKASKFV